MKSNKYLIIPQCSDLNRGDQALVWETRRVAEDSGFIGDYYMMCDSEDTVIQSKNKGFNVISSILKHPARKSKKSSNIKYGIGIKLRWGVTSVFDIVFSYLMLFGFMRTILRPLLHNDTKRCLDLYKNVDAVFVKGGGFIHSYGGVIGTYYIYFMLYHIRLAQKFGKPVYVMPNSYGPFMGRFVKMMVKRTLKNCKLVLSRESISTEMAHKDLGISIPVYPDLGFFLHKSDRREIEGYLTKQRVPIGSKRLVAITLRPYRFPGSKNADLLYMKYKRSFIEFIQHVNNKGFHILLIEHTLSHNKHESDISAISDILPSVSSCDCTLISDSSLDCSELKSIYSCCDYVIGTRFHSVIFSISEIIPSIAIAYGGNKGKGIMKDLGLEDYSISIYKVTGPELISKFDSLVQNTSDLKRMLSSQRNKRNSLREKLIEVLSKFTD